MRGPCKKAFSKLSMKDLLKRIEFAQLGKKKALVIALASFAIIYLDFAFIIRLQWQGIIRLSPQIAQVRNSLANFANDMARMQDLKARQTAAKEGVSPKTKKLIAQGQMSSVLENISMLANNNNVKILQMKPSDDLQSKQKKAVDVQKYTPSLINLDLICGYHQFGSFINDLENALVFFSVSEFKISRQESDLLQQKVSLVLKTYARK